MNDVPLRNRIRGFVVGYCLGDAASRAGNSADSSAPLRVGTAGTLFLANVEGVIRGIVRAELHGLSGGTPSCCWHATLRWAVRSGLTVPVRAGRDGQPSPEWEVAQAYPGWLEQVPSLRGSRGPAPSMAAALCGGPAQWPGPQSTDGELAVARVLPMALLATAVPTEAPARQRSDWVAGQATVSAAYTHTIGARFFAAAAAQTAGHVLAEGVLDGFDDLEWPTNHAGELYAVDEEVGGARDVLEEVSEMLWALPDPAAFASLQLVGKPKTALRAVAAGLTLATTQQPVSGSLRPLLDAVAAYGEPGPGAVALALAGAAYGAQSLPMDAVDRLDVAHVADILAGDLADWLTRDRNRDDRDVVSLWLPRYPMN